MELIVAVAIALLVGAAVYLMQGGALFPVVLGMTVLSYGVNAFVLAMGRLPRSAPPLLDSATERYADPLPQALVLTAIVISFGMTAVTVALAIWCRSEHEPPIDARGAPAERDPE
jgi:multicomponent K+:H+ antiporter subunit C